MSSERLGKALFMALASTFVEQKILPKVGFGFLGEQGGVPPSFTKAAKAATDASAAIQLPMSSSFLPCGYGLVVAVVTITYLWLLMTGMSVGAARSKYARLAEKDGEKNVSERYELPNLYARELVTNE